jgi:peptidoglycan hydrolase-like protein with peptidoglycan-binding domain
MSLVAVMLVAGATTTSAQTMSLCQTVDALVLAGVIAPDKVVAAKAAAGCTAAAPATAAFTRNLTIGSTGADVTALQTKLGVTPATGYFGAITKAAVVAYQTANGIVPASGYVGPLTLAKLNAGVVVVPVTPVTPVTPVVSGLNGGAGDLDVVKTSTDVENSLKEGEEGVKVLGVKAEADGSDIEVTSIKVTLTNASSTDGTSEKLTNYLDEVIIMLGDEEVGSVDADDFTKTSDTPDTFSKTISLKEAVIRENDDEKIYVAVSAGSIDSEDLSADWNVVIDTIRYVDATGAILTASLPSSVDTTGETFSFDDVTTDDDIDIKSSSANPDNETVRVEDDSVSDEILALVFKLDVDEDSADVMITSIPVVLTVTAAGSNASSIEDIIDEVIVTIDGTDYEADLSGTGTISNGTGTATYIVEIDDEDVVIDAGDVVDVKVALVFNDQDEEANYAQNTVVVASVNGANIDAETSEDDITVTGGTKTGATLTLNTSAALLSAISWTKAEGTAAASIDLFFTLEADQNDIIGFEKADVVETKTNIATAGVLTKISGDATETATGVFTISDGDSANFRVRYTVSTTGGEVNLSTVNGQVVPDAKKLSPTAYYQ